MGEITTFTNYVLQYRYEWRDRPVTWPNTGQSYKTLEEARLGALAFNETRRKREMDPMTLRIARVAVSTEVIESVEEA